LSGASIGFARVSWPHPIGVNSVANLPHRDRRYPRAPEEIQSLHYAATVFANIADYADMLERPANQLRHLLDAGELLLSVSDSPRSLPDTAEVLSAI
jgi:hypothetical protein